MQAMNDGETAVIELRLAQLRERVAAACTRAGRDPEEVRLVAVTKTFGPDTVAAAQRAGLSCFGENRVQEAAAKIAACGRAEWHLVGHLQRNKVGAALALFETIHSVDSIRLLEALAAGAAESGARPRLLLEVNVAGEASKFGFAPEAVPAALDAAARLGAPPVEGLMTVPPFAPDPEAARPHFRRLRELRDGCRDRTGFALPELSMGMSGDFEVAVEEGATMIRIGTFLFGRRIPWAQRRPADDPSGEAF